MFRLLKKLQMQGVEERGMRRIFVYAAVTSDEDNAADGLFQQPAKDKNAKRRKAERAISPFSKGGLRGIFDVIPGERSYRRIPAIQRFFTPFRMTNPICGCRHEPLNPQNLRPYFITFSGDTRWRDRPSCSGFMPRARPTSWERWNTGIPIFSSTFFSASFW